MKCLRPLLMLSLLATGGAAAETLYKCQSANGETSVQSKPCPKGSTQVWRRDATPDPVPTPEQLQAAEQRRQQDTQNAKALSVIAGTAPPEAEPAPPPPPPKPPEPVADDNRPKGPCRRAHEFADAIRANNAWLEMRDDQLFRLDGWVAEQCREAREGE